MEDLTRSGRVRELNLASRRAEEAALRRYQAVYWLDYLVGPLGIPSQPSEKEFISCLRNGLILCNVINKIQPGSVSKVIEKTTPSPSLLWDSQPLPAYQYFENVRNFLVAVQELKLPNFEASVFERENLEVGSSTKVVDCILALKDYHEWKQMTGGNGFYKPPRSPIVVHSSGRINGRDSARQLDMSRGNKPMMPSESDIRKLEDAMFKALAQHMADAKENMDSNLVQSNRSGNAESVNFLSKILSSCLEEQFRKKCPEMKSSILDYLKERSSSIVPSSICGPLADLSNVDNRKQDVESLQSQLQSDLKQLGDQVLKMSNAALGYHQAVKENRNLYNMVQDLKGNIRVYCRIRPTINSEVKNVIDFIGKDGSLVVVDPKPLKDGKKVFQFNQVFGPTATQDEVFRDMQPLVRSVMDGYNVCIFAYGQTGSGKTHTMYGPPGGSAKELGISYLSLKDLFELSDQRKDITKYEIQVQMVEIYNEQVRDLLAEDSSTKKYPFAFKMLFDSLKYVCDNNLALPDATLRPVKSADDVINLMKLGEVNRAVSSTAMNSTSSRSHSVLSVHVHGEDASGSVIHSCLHLVDLAGSERVDKSEVTGDGLREAQHINKSLSCLVDVMTALAQKNSHIPYRNSKLTLLLQSSLGGNAKTLMFAHVGPEGDSFGETMSTLKFAQRVSTVELGAARANKESSEVLELKAQIESLKKELGNREIQTPPAKKLKESAKTPPRPRRLSIENGGENPLSAIKPKQMTTERTPPPRPRRLSIENGLTNHDDNRKGAKTPSTKARSRRLSLEGGPRNAQEVVIISKPVEPEVRCSQNLGFNSSNQRAPLSPLRSSALKSPIVKIDTATMKVVVPPFPKTPEPRLKPENEIQRAMQNDRNMGLENQTPSSTIHGKGSQLRKSLRTIGKFINGSEKRNQQKVITEATTPSHAIKRDAAKSPTSTNARASRRQSLTGIQIPESSRRSSLGGISTDSYGNGNRNARTPPTQVGASAKLTKRWL
ncbi:kinesin-4 [Phtheirospermum japonicum]|uniref:Kinesin-4 n=1 Tax=Phtheirospermum japonicum TaxID=374723 RepID=A0A830C834_9LAMI|nr:kinesin-4 [Phtheirospermum japonicum]